MAKSKNPDPYGIDPKRQMSLFEQFEHNNYLDSLDKAAKSKSVKKWLKKSKKSAS